MTRLCRVVNVATFVIALSLMGGCSSQKTTIATERLRAFSPLPERFVSSVAGASATVELGRMLYYDSRLSKSGEVSCNSCHPLTKYGVDGQPTSPGHAGQRGTRNTPTVYNAALHFTQFWDGRAPDVEAQAGGPILNPVEMAMPSESAVVEVLKSMPKYVSAFRKAYPGDRNPVTFRRATEAIGAFERGLVTPSRWDRFLKGDDTALTPGEKAGFNHFVDAGCNVCHAGALMGGDAFQRIGIRKAYPDHSDLGRFTVTHQNADRLLFKVPSLRNVAMTGPYFHDGKVPTLEDAVSMMATYQTGKSINLAAKDAIVTWLRSLTWELPDEYIKQPELPASTARTPKPSGV